MEQFRRFECGFPKHRRTERDRWRRGFECQLQCHRSLFGSKGVATVTGSNSQWNSSGLLVGHQGSGTLNIEAGGVVSNEDNGYLGDNFGSTGIATVTGAESQWNNSNSLYIGGSRLEAGGSGTLNIDDSGLVTVSGTTKLWSGGTVNLNGGTLDVGVLDLTLGTFNMLDGLLHADSVVDDLNNQGGTLAPGQSPGILTVTDDYVQGAAATLEIELGGTVRGDEYDALIVNGNLTSTAASTYCRSTDLYRRPVTCSISWILNRRI